MVDTHALATLISSVIAFVLMAVALVMGIRSVAKFEGGGRFKKSNVLFLFYLVSFVLAVGFMTLYHYNSSEMMEKLWFVFLNLGFALGIGSTLYFRSFWYEISKTNKR